LQIAAYREDNDGVKFYLIHVFAPTETCDKWMDTRIALAKANGVFNPRMVPTPASDGPPIENKKTKALRNATPNTRLLRLNLVVVPVKSAHLVYTVIATRSCAGEMSTTGGEMQRVEKKQYKK
jgi:hypothetical protein